MNKLRWLFVGLLGALLIESFIVFCAPLPVSATIANREQSITPPDSGFHGVRTSTGGDGDDTRIEYEVKLRTPLEQTDAVWEWLQMRYADSSWLNQDGYVFQAMFGDEDFTDTYFDTPNLHMLAEMGGVRHRRRVVHSGPAKDKDNRELIQIKLNRGDAIGLARSEIKFDVSTRRNGKDGDNGHPMLGLVKKNQREEFKAVLQFMDVDPYIMRTILVLEQNRRRVYLSDQEGAFATLTLDLCSTNSWRVDLRWAEVELELNEIRYTEATEADRQKMARVIGQIQEDLQQTFPQIVMDQTPKYNTAFAAIEATTWLPLRQLILWEMSIADFTVILLVSLLTVCSAIWYGGRWLWGRIR